MYPEEGRSAIAAAAHAVADLRLGRIDEETTANVGTISGGTARNVVPEHCRLVAEARSHDEAKVAFKDLPNRFPSVLSLDFRNDATDYEDYDNLYAMYLLYNLGKYSVRLDETTQRLEIYASKDPMPYTQATNLAEQNAEADSRGFLRRLVSKPQGKRIGD